MLQRYMQRGCQLALASLQLGENLAGEKIAEPSCDVWLHFVSSGPIRTCGICIAIVNFQWVELKRLSRRSPGNPE